MHKRQILLKLELQIIPDFDQMQFFDQWILCLSFSFSEKEILTRKNFFLYFDQEMPV
jgi:hypothetical protein